MLLQSIFNQQTFKDQKKSLEAYLSKFGEYIQPLVDTYMSLSSTMKILGTAKHEEFGETEETGLLVNILDIHPEVIERFRSNVKD